ncbi:ABC transporter substrate-binding protein [Paracoccus jiaweipingae]|uniref:ABC transporter substrate-binding protein n=1 Tax=unclassified Paracoccus (in: a-proteobacteria) TaxID=2688777 RepID=UPI0037BB487C
MPDKTKGRSPVKNPLSARALLLASVVALAPAAHAATPADMLVVGAQIDDIISLDPAQSFEFSGNDVTKNLYDKLVDFDATDLGKGFQPELAESWQVSEDGLSITFKIRQGAKFHSGNPVRAEDAAWSLQRAVKLNKTPAFILTQFGFTADNVAEKIVADGDSLTLHLDKPYAQSFVLNCLTANIASVVDKETVMAHAQGDDMGNTWLNTNDAGSGAFTLGGWKPNEAVTLQAFADYWRGAPAMTRVVIKHVQESATQRLQLERGDIDVARNLNPSDIEGLAGNDALKIEDQLRGYILYMGLNQKNELLKNPAVVEAMKHLVDYDGIANSFLKGQYTPHQAFLPSGYLGAVDDLPWTYDVEKARQILKDAGIGGGTITTKVRDIPEYVNTALALQGSMAQVGLTLKIEQMTGAQVLDAYRAREVPIFLGEWGPDYSDPQTNAGTFAWNPDNSDEARLTGSLAWRNAYAVPQSMNDAVEAAQLEQDTDKRAQMYHDLQVEYQKTGAILPLFQKIEQPAMQKNVQHWNSGGAVTSVSYDQVTKE